MRKNSRLSALLFRELQVVGVQQAQIAEWTSEGDQKRKIPEYVRRSRHFVNKP